jgi:4-diphosphocytidyl-2C-methyl-D-erythritol kinase
MLWEAKKYGARVALYGRKINNAEHQLSFITYLRAIADDQIEPEEAVKAYHGDLQKLGLRPQRSLADDLQKTETATSYSGSGSTVRKSAVQRSSSQAASAAPDFSKMSQAEKVQWNMNRWKRIVG